MSALVLPSNDDSLPDPDLSGIRPVGPNVLIRPVEIKDKTDGGLIIPDAVRQDFTFIQTLGKVLAKSPTAYDENIIGPDDWLNVGDYVAWHRTEGQKMMTREGLLLVLLPYERVLLHLDNPDLLDTSGYFARK